MTLNQLANLYNFHDCYVFTPFKIDDGSITVTFDLVKCLQYEELKARYGDFVQKKDSHLIVVVEFSNCSNLKISEVFLKPVKAKTRSNSKAISLDEFDTEADFISLSIADSDICFVWDAVDHKRKTFEIQFNCENAMVLEEKLLDTIEF